MRDEYSRPVLVEVQENETLTDTPFKRAADTPDSVVMRRKEGAGWRDITAAEFRDDVAAVAKGLIAAGIGTGDRVGLMSRTRYEWTVADYGIWAAGAVTVPIYETSSEEQVRWILGDSEAKAVFTETDGHTATVEAVRGELPALRNVWRLEPDLSAFTATGAEIGDDQLAAARGSVGADALATLIYTSGTTGRPKGCELTHRNLLFTIRNVIEGNLKQVFTVEGRSTLLFMTLAHSFPRVIQVGCVETHTVMGHTADLADLLPDLASYQPTFLLAVPRVFEKVYNGAEQKAVAGGKGSIFAAATDTAIAYSKAVDTGGPGLVLKLKHLLFDRLVYGKLRDAVGGHTTHAVAGGAALGERLGHFFRGIGLPVFEGYGLTETSAPSSVNGPDAVRIGTVGRPFPGVAVRTASDGELLVRGDHVMRGYWKNETATKEAFTEDGWLRTGDLGTIDDDGFIRITGRKKEILVTAGGKNVAPAVVEDRLRGHALVSQCMLVGDGKPFVAALITIDPDALEFWKSQNGKPESAGVAELVDDPDLLAAVQEAVDDANKAVSKAESVRKFTVLPVDFTVEGGQMTPSLKVKREVVAREFAAEIDALYASR
ncbi:AMP-dependent synthetase/ligase [Allonocardiopsis opalescens]|uniref:Acyl-CoA synthetase n=1 Tax=Allonocardiopsis opalescens TaxID=1144618 RepID=A0A2T0PZR6_9ACTN|nr:long-chain fatty acid--CoA ligase [Allonocardiopsis opalescens]PRX97028.1 long-chain acyl-CoA synthetase [Allonocardiopsis opalescens]